MNAPSSSIKTEAKILQDRLSKAMNMIKAFAQRLQEQQQAGNGQPQLDPETMAKIQAMQITAQAKVANTRESHAARTAQRAVQFEMEQEQKQAATMQELMKQAEENRIDLEAQTAKAALEIEKERARPTRSPVEE